MPSPRPDAFPVLPPLEWGVAARALPGETQSGDLHLVQPFPGGVLVAVVDALGHGAEAAATAQVAVTALTRYAHEPLGSLLRRCHDALVRTRGAVMSLATLDEGGETLTWIGVGNVEGVLLPANHAPRPDRPVLIPQPGIVGSDLPAVRAELLHLSAGDTVVFATDGVRSGFAEGLQPTGPPQHIAEAVLARSGKGTDDALVLVARYVGRAHATP